MLATHFRGEAPASAEVVWVRGDGSLGEEGEEGAVEFRVGRFLNKIRGNFVEGRDADTTLTVEQVELLRRECQWLLLWERRWQRETMRKQELHVWSVAERVELLVQLCRETKPKNCEKVSVPEHLVPEGKVGEDFMADRFRSHIIDNFLPSASVHTTLGNTCFGPARTCRLRFCASATAIPDLRRGLWYRTACCRPGARRGRFVCRPSSNASGSTGQ